ncbi:MAG: glutamate--tRNA ligase family protein [Vicinamibacterales bacterium]
MLASTGHIDGRRLAARLAPVVDHPLTRFAPAPTGQLHLGHVVNAVIVWGLARALAGRVLLRIEDHDRQRARPAFERGILDDLDWLGLAPDLYPTDAFRAGPCPSRQSERGEVYRAALEALAARGLVYGCDCSRRQIEARRIARTGEPGELHYPGTCRDRGLPLADGLGWRVRMDAGAVTFDDGLVGVVTHEPAGQCGDVLVRDRLGNWTYQWAASVDDWRQRVSLVIRGTDLLASTGRQIRLAALAGRPEPARFVHHPLVMKSATQKLSKSDGDTGVSDLRAAGWTPGRVLGAAAAAIGLRPAGGVLAAGDLGDLFAL